MTLSKQGKIWGFTQEIFNKNNVSINRICINKNSCCSKHCHDYKTNIFWVESGEILVEEWKKEYNLVDKTILKKGEYCSVPPKSYHRFTGLSDSVVYEIYYVELIENDIIREDTGSSKIKKIS
jgi:quercetin dioxygenase-like cupin family protein